MHWANAPRESAHMHAPARDKKTEPHNESADANRNDINALQECWSEG